MSVLKELKTETIKEYIAPSVLASYYDVDIPTTKKGLITQVTKETENAGVKELASLMKAMELREVCDYLEVEYKEGATMNSRMMLSKRFVETFDEVTVAEWFAGCEDKAILGSICTIMGFVVTKKSAIEDLRSAAISQIRMYGESVVLHRLPVNALQQVCEDMGLDGAFNTQSKRILIQAIIKREDIPEHEVKKVVRTRKKAIRNATIKGELQQHYKAKDLESWCKENGLKSSGTKNALIDRILAYNAGDTENTMATNVKKTKSVKKAKTPAKKVTKKVTKKVEEPSEEEMVEQSEEQSVEEQSAEEQEAEQEAAEQSEEEQDQSASEEDAEAAEAAAIAAERDLRVTEEVEVEEDEDEISLSISQSGSAENDYPTTIEGLSFAIKGKGFTHTKKELQDIVVANGGIIAKKVKKDTIVISTDEKFNTTLQSKGVPVHGEEYLSNFF